MRRYFLFYFLICFAFASYSQNEIKAFPTHNQSPLIHFFGLQVNPGGQILKPHQFEFQNALNIANNATAAALEKESIYFDGEMYRNEIRLRYGLSRNFELSLCIPIVKHSGGFMDPVISTWHDAFGLPGKARETMTDYHLSYWYMEENQIVLLMRDSKLEIGDISMGLGFKLLDASRNKIALRGFLKLASGNKKMLIGSGTNDFGLQITGSILPKLSRKNDWFYLLGYMKIGQGALLNDLISKDVVFGNIGTALQLNEHWVPKIQFDFHSQFYKKSETKQLGKASIQMVLGVDYFIRKNLNLFASFSEDLIVNTAPDFVLQFGVNYKL